jgi:molecular chaperone GrpE
MPNRDDYEEKDIKMQPESEEAEFEGASPSIDELQIEIDRLRVELEEERNRTKEEHESHLRALADFSNFRRRHQEDYKQAIQFAAQELILKILPVIDNFQRALDAAEQTNSFESLMEGVRLTLRQLQGILEREGVKPIKAAGEMFDPMLHEAVMRVETDEYPENTVIDELETGYTQHDKVIRPSKVRVAASPE